MENLVKRLNPIHVDTTVIKFHEQPESELQSQLITSISFSLIQLVSENRSRPFFKSKIKAQAHSPFTSLSIPSISLSDYLHRIWKYSKIEETSLIIGLIYIDRLCKKKKIILTEFNVHRIVFCCIIIAVKFNEDKYYSKIGGMDLKQLNEMEMELLISINFDLFIESKVYDKYYRNLCADIA